MATETKDYECCPPFDPAPWDDKTFTWDKKLFVKEDVLTLFYMPVNFGGAMKRLMKLVDKEGAEVPDYLCLADHTSRWNMSLYLAVDREVTNAENVTISGTFYSRVYEGNFRDTGKWCADFMQQARERGYNVDKMYMWYTTCPKCAKKYGKNYVVIIAKI